MGYQPRIEAPDKANFLTTRTLHSKLWFVNNHRLERAILGYVAKFVKRYNVALYALAIEGNHIQGPALFPKGNRASFMRDLNSAVARAVPRETNHPGGRFWARRYSNEFLPGAEDIKEYFFYTVLQPVQDGLVADIAEYPGYNCFKDAIWGRKKKFKVVRWAEYNRAVKKNQNPDIEDYTDTVTLEYTRLPGYEAMPQREYVRVMQEELRVRQAALVAERKGQGFAGRAALQRTVPGALPQSTKRSTIQSHRPRILCVCPKRRAEATAWYFDIYFRYKDASAAYRNGNRDVTFPPGTYPPHLPCHCDFLD